MARRDFTQVAFDIAQLATGAATPIPDDRTPYQKAAAGFGSEGGKIGGKARSSALTKKQRVAIAKKAAKARWG